MNPNNLDRYETLPTTALCIIDEVDNSVRLLLGPSQRNDITKAYELIEC